MTTIVEFPASLPQSEVEEFLGSVQTIQFTHQQTDNLHHKYLVTSRYPDDFVSIGIFVGYKMGGQFGRVTVTRKIL